MIPRHLLRIEPSQIVTCLESSFHGASHRFANNGHPDNKWPDDKRPCADGQLVTIIATSRKRQRRIHSKSVADPSGSFRR